MSENPWNSDPFDAMDLYDLADELKDRLTENGKVTPTDIQEVAAEYETTAAEVYASVALAPEIILQKECSLTFEVCIGRCQFSGGAGALRELVARRNKENPSFDIVARSCLDACDNAPVVRSQGPNGTYIHPDLTPHGLLELVDALTSD